MNGTSFTNIAFSNLLNNQYHEPEQPQSEEHAFYLYQAEYVPGIEELLKREDNQYRNNSFIYKVFVICESYFYYANRYRDKLSFSLRNTSNILLN